jgi:DNA-directed RNA polymerase specialized sigma subunit
MNIIKSYPTPESFAEDKKLKLEKELRVPFYNLVKSNFSRTKLSEFLNLIDPVLTKAINVYGGAFNSDLLRSRAKYYAIKAIKDYDPTKSSMTTHLYTRLKRLMEDTRYEIYPTYISSKEALLRNKINTAIKELTNKLGHEPSAAQIADHTGISLRKVEKILGKSINIIGEGVEERGEEGESVRGVGTGTVVVERPGVKEQKFKLLLESVYLSLDPLHQAIMEEIYGMYGKKPKQLADIARKYRLTPARISQIKSNIDQKIKEFGETAFGIV